MLRVLVGALPHVPTHVGSAERIPLDDGAVHATVVGQAWHWFEPAAASREIGRVLRPGGTLGLVWNIRDGRVPWVARMTEIMHGSAAEHAVSNGEPAVHAPFGVVESRRFEWTRPMTAELLRAMAHSRSYVINAEPENRARIERELAELFGALPELASGGVIELPYVTHAFRATASG